MWGGRRRTFCFGAGSFFWILPFLDSSFVFDFFLDSFLTLFYLDSSSYWTALLFTGPDKTSTTPLPHNTKPHLHGLALCHGNILVVITHSGGPGRIPTVPECLCGGRLWMSTRHHWHTLDVSDERTSLTRNSPLFFGLSSSFGEELLFFFGERNSSSFFGRGTLLFFGSGLFLGGTLLFSDTFFLTTFLVNTTLEKGFLGGLLGAAFFPGFFSFCS